MMLVCPVSLISVEPRHGKSPDRYRPRVGDALRSVGDAPNTAGATANWVADTPNGAAGTASTGGDAAQRLGCCCVMQWMPPPRA
ncbi:hypothetical protein JCM18882A_03900 [Brevibacterium metallidurans]|uniref:Uncharacterized protein n=1 Tax=Brevibacterium metallidurans TaxID=1482676 RepID=A0ABN0SIU2_9MICO